MLESDGRCSGLGHHWVFLSIIRKVHNGARIPDSRGFWHAEMQKSLIFRGFPTDE
jgi:hypothetical protein